MPNYIVNAFVNKKTNTRRNFWITSNSTDESNLKKLILERLDDQKKEWQLVEDSLKLIEDEKVIIYECKFKKIEE